MAVRRLAPRRFYNPVQKDAATLLESSDETNGERTLGEVELAPGGGNPVHFHRAFTERFVVLEGSIRVRLGKTSRVLTAGQTVVVQPGVLHCFANPTDRPARFLVELRPGHTGFEQAIQIAYGLAADGKTTAKGMPKNLYHLAVIFVMADSNVPGIMSLLTPLLRFLAARARKNGIEQELIQKYVRV
jgi:quercetin dioxygenase-like cupin family protein